MVSLTTKNSYILLLLIVFFAGILRFWQLDKNPPSMYWDEVSQGYNTYSILKTGHDEHGEFFPLARFQAFGDYKAPVYIYLDVPFMAIFGKNTFGVRFPSAFFGTLTVLVTYFLVYTLFYTNDSKRIYALLAAFLLAISPWHILLSRGAFEANIATFFTVLGIFLFYWTLRRNSKLFFLSAISFVLAFYAFNAHRVFIPLFVLVLVIFNSKVIIQNKKQVLIACIIGIILFIPSLQYIRSLESRLRFQEVNIFTNLDTVKQSNEWIAQDNNSLFSKIIHNRRVLFSLSYIKHYFDFFNSDYLFFSGDGNPRFSIRDNGELFLWELPFILAGFYVLLIRRTKESFVLLFWFFLAPIAAATARETPHALRSETFIPTYEIFCVIGIVQLTTLFKKHSLFYKLGIFCLVAVMILSLYGFLHNYFVHYPIRYAREWQYGYKEVIEEVKRTDDRYDYIVFSNIYGRPYIYWLFYGDVEPSDYWRDKEINRDTFGFYNVTQIGKYFFRERLVAEEDAGKKVLYVGASGEIQSGLSVIKTIPFPDGTTAFTIAKNN